MDNTTVFPIIGVSGIPERDILGSPLLSILRAGCLGLAFKANIDDFRESPARFVAANLAREYGERIQIVEPYAAELPKEFDGSGASAGAAEDALDWARAIDPEGLYYAFMIVENDCRPTFLAKPMLSTKG